jgi:hypothetical protein
MWNPHCADPQEEISEVGVPCPSPAFWAILTHVEVWGALFRQPALVTLTHSLTVIACLGCARHWSWLRKYIHEQDIKEPHFREPIDW